jgi:hypothetical protein
VRPAGGTSGSTFKVEKDGAPVLDTRLACLAFELEGSALAAISISAVINRPAGVLISIAVRGTARDVGEGKYLSGGGGRKN